LAAGTKSIFLTYPAEKSVNLDASDNVSPLGTVSSGVWQGSTVGVAYGGTGVTTSSGANSVVLRDGNQNIAVNRVNQSNTNTTAAGGTTALSAASSYIHTLVGTGGQTYTLPDATTLTTGVAFVFNNLATGTLTLANFAGTTIGTIPSGGAGAVFLTLNSTTGGTWDLHAYLPEGVTFGTNAFNLGTSIISGGTWQGGTIQTGYGGTGLTSYTSGGAVYANSSSTLTSGTLPITAGGTGNTTGNSATTSQTNFSNLTIGGSQVLSAANYNSYAPTLTGGGASGTWGVRITGFANAGSQRLYSTDASYNYDSANPYFGYLTYNGSANRWRFQVSPATPSAVEVAYADAAGSAGAVDYANLTNKTGGTGTYTTSGDYRAPIFYDSNNTSYYVDPASGSSLAGNVSIAGNVILSTGANRYVQIGSATNYYYTLQSTNDNFEIREAGSTPRLTISYPTGSVTASADFRAPIFYDSNDTSYYVNPNGVSVLSNLIMSSSAVSNNTNGLRNVMPGGGSYVTSSASVSGAIVITLPVTVYPMIRFRVTVYTYDGLSFDIYCGGHNSGGYWYNTFAYMTTQSRPAMTVRFSYGGGSMYVYIGDLGGSWTYPQVFITDVQVGYTDYSYTYWDDGWSIGFNTSSYNNVVSSHTVYPPASSGNNTNPVYASIYYDADNTGTYINPNGSSIISSGGYYPMEFRSSQRYITRFWNQGASSYGWWIANDANSIVFHADSSGDKAYLDTSGNFTAIGSYRSPIFYDSDNTAYYIDANNTSVLNSLNVAGTIASTNGNGYIRLYGNLHIDSYNSNDIYLNYYSGRRVYAFYGSQVQSFRADLDGIVYAFYQFRTPITYDNDNTAYYCDPASATQLNYLYTSNNIRGSNGVTAATASISSGYGGFGGTPSNGYLITTNISYSVFNMPTIIVEGYAYGNAQTIHIEIVWYSYAGGFVNQSYTNLGAWDPGTVRIGTNGSDKICIHFSNNIYYGRMNVRGVYDQGAAYLLDWSVQQDVSYSGLSRVTTVGTQPIRAGMNTSDNCYAPILYDVNNTAYYVDPHQTSRMGTINADSLYSYGNVTAYSDERLKTDWEVLPADYVEKLAKVKSGTYTRIDSGERQVGVGAQSLQVILAEAVSDKQEYLGVNYGNAALVSAVELAKYVTALEERIKQLEARL